MMRTSFQPLAHLVDAAAEKWLAAEQLSEAERRTVHEEITASFRIGDSTSLTFHGLRYLLCISQVDAGKKPDIRADLHIDVHEIVLND